MARPGGEGAGERARLRALRALRARYGASKAGDVRDPVFRRVVRLLYQGTDRRRLPYAGPPTLLDAPSRPAPAGLAGLDVALLGIPMDLGVTNRPGARFGPRAVRAMERIGPYHHVHRLAPAAECAIADVGDVPFRGRFSLEESIEDIERFYARIAAASVAPLAIGGDHSVTYPILRALGRRRPVGLVHVDAHCDTGGPFEGSKFHHGGPFRHAVLDGVLDPRRTIQIGIRGTADFLWEFSHDAGMTVVHMEEFARLGPEAVAARAREVVGAGPVYVSFDVDGLDPAYAPGTGTPEVGGIAPREAQALLRGLAGLDVIGGDVVEIAPQYDPTTVTAQVGAQMAFEILCLVVLARRQAVAGSGRHARRSARPAGRGARRR
jgi:agmatinase